MTVSELIKKLQELENRDGENLLCLNVVFADEDGDQDVKLVKVVESYNFGESRKVRLLK